MRTVYDPISCLPAAADIFTKDDLRATTTHGTIRLVAIFIVAIQRLREVLLQTVSRGVSSRWNGRGRLLQKMGQGGAKQTTDIRERERGSLGSRVTLHFTQRPPSNNGCRTGVSDDPQDRQKSETNHHTLSFKSNILRQVFSSHKTYPRLFCRSRLCSPLSTLQNTNNEKTRHLIHVITMFP